MFWVIGIVMVGLAGYLLYQNKNAALTSLKTDAKAAVAEFDKHVVTPAGAMVTKEFSAAIAALKKHL